MYFILLLNRKTDRMILSTFVLFVTLMVVAECSNLQENHEVIRELTDTIHRIDKEMKQKEKQNNEVISDLSEAIHRLEAKVAETDIKRDEEMKKTITRLEEGFCQRETKADDIKILREDFAKLQGRVT